MILARVLGPLWSSTQDPGFDGLSLKLAQPIDAATGDPAGPAILAADSVQSGPDDIVIIVYEGGSARQVIGRPKSPCEAVIVGIVDRIDMLEEHQWTSNR